MNLYFLIIAFFTGAAVAFLFNFYMNGGFDKPYKTSSTIYLGTYGDMIIGAIFTSIFVVFINPGSISTALTISSLFQKECKTILSLCPSPFNEC